MGKRRSRRREVEEDDDLDLIQDEGEEVGDLEIGFWIAKSNSEFVYVNPAVDLR